VGHARWKINRAGKLKKRRKIKDGLQGTFWVGWKLGQGGRKEKKKENETVGPN
jgi:hypothetical protein